MTARIRSIDYEHDGYALRGEFAWDDTWTAPRPGVVVVHDAMKSSQGFEEERAVTLAGMGFAGFALDVYGAGVQGADEADAARLMQPFRDDRGFLQERLQAGLRAAIELPEIDPERMAAIGYCFGGMSVLDLARWNAPVAGVASFHGLLDAPPPNVLAETRHEPITAKVLVLHGWEDPFVPPDDLQGFASEMTEREADWQLLTFGNTAHAFTNVRYDDRERGVQYDARADRRAWRALTNFLEELFPA